MRRAAMLIVLLAVASFAGHPIEAQRVPEEEADLSSAATQDRLVVFEAFMRPT